MRHFIVFASLMIYSTCFGQSFKILDSESKSPVPFATALLIENGKPATGYYADEEGSVVISSTKVYDRVELSCIGYAGKTITKDKLADGVIYLERIAYTLDEVVVSVNAKPTEVGFTKGRGKYHPAAKRGAQAVLFIENAGGKEKRVKSFVFKASTPKKFRTAFRIHFYKKDVLTGMPGEELPHEDIVKYIDAGKGVKAIEVDVTSFGINLPVDGMYAGIEWLSSTNAEGKVLGDEDYEGWYQTNIEYNTDLDVSRTYVKLGLEDLEWKATSSGNASFWLKVFED
jgi:hypothetical protein